MSALQSQNSNKGSRRRLVAMAIVGAGMAVLGGLFTVSIQPAAAREVRAACNGLRPSPTNESLQSVPTEAPVDFTAQDHTGNPVSLADFRGQVVFVNFWATWCNVCKSEKPGLERMAEELQQEYDDFHVLSVASDPDWELIRERFPDGTPLNILLDPPTGDANIGPIAKSFGVTAMPESFVIDREGKVRHYFINKRDWDSGISETCLRSIIEEDA